METIKPSGTPALAPELTQLHASYMAARVAYNAAASEHDRACRSLLTEALEPVQAQPTPLQSLKEKAYRAMWDASVAEDAAWNAYCLASREAAKAGCKPDRRP